MEPYPLTLSGVGREDGDWDAVSLEKMIDHLVALPRLLLLGWQRDDDVIGAELTKGVIERRRTQLVASRPRSRNALASKLLENDLEALIGRLSRRVDASGKPLDRADETWTHHPDLRR